MTEEQIKETALRLHGLADQLNQAMDDAAELGVQTEIELVSGEYSGAPDGTAVYFPPRIALRLTTTVPPPELKRRTSEEPG